MDCSNAIELIEQCFDNRLEPTSNVEKHLEGCSACMEKYNQLAQLDLMMSDLPIDIPIGIEERIVEAIEQEQQSQKQPVQLIAMVASALIGLSLLAWLIPVKTIQVKLLSYVEQWLPDTQWLEANMSYQEQLEVMMAKTAQWMSEIEWVSSAMIWGALASTVLLLMILNGLCAAQMRHTSQ